MYLGGSCVCGEFFGGCGREGLEEDVACYDAEYIGVIYYRNDGFWLVCTFRRYG